MKLSKLLEQETLFKPMSSAEHEVAKDKKLGELKPIYDVMEPKIDTARQLVEDMEEALSGGHGDEGSFDIDIKMRSLSLPSELSDFFGGEYPESFDHLYWEEIQLQLSNFMDELETKYPIEKWYQEGRSGGWLVIYIDKPTIDDEDWITAAENIFSDLPSKRDLLEIDRGLTGTIKSLNKTLMNIDKIENEVIRSRRSLEKMMSTKEYWADIIPEFAKYLKKKEKVKVKK